MKIFSLAALVIVEVAAAMTLLTRPTPVIEFCKGYLLALGMGG